MLYNAVVKSPLGRILLQADQAGLAGLYFTSQKDCPNTAGLNDKKTQSGSPADGMLNNRPLRKYKLKPIAEEKQTGLFADKNHKADFINPAREFLANPANHDFAEIEFLDVEIPDSVKKTLTQTASELNEYWHHQRSTFTVKLNPQGSEFQKKIWQELIKIPLGGILSYGELGKKSGFGSGHGRAIGTAVGSNPISIIIPCHRVLAANGTLNGYGGGLQRKAYLLQLEGFRLQP